MSEPRRRDRPRLPRSLRRVAVLALLVAVALALAPTTGAASCDATGERPAVVASAGDSPYAPGADVPVYAGSEFEVRLCAPPGSNARLAVEDQPGLTVLHGTDDVVQVRVGSAPDEPASEELPERIRLGDLVAPEPIPGPNVTVAGHAVATTLLDRPIAAPSAVRAAALRDADRTFREREARATERFAALAAATEDVEAGEHVGPGDASAGAGDGGDAAGPGPIENATAAHEDLQAAGDDLREELFRAADSDVGSARTTRALDALAEREAAVDETGREQVGAYERALTERERSLTRSLRLRVLGGALLGLLVGAAAGGALPAHRGRLAIRRLERGEWTTYTRRVALLPAALGALLLLLALGWFALEVGWTVLEVVT